MTVPPARVVVAEDSVVVRAVVRQHLEEHGYVVIEADDGTAALDACRRGHPDAALLDIEMPGLDGYEVLRRLRDDPDLSGIPVVFLTSRTATADLVTGLQLGAHDYLRKPFESAELIARVGSAVRVKRLQDELRLRNADLEAVSRTDSLTALHNRRHAAEHLTMHASASRRHGWPLSLLLVDIDHFKGVNDGYGHAGGDAVLREFANRLLPAIRSEDIAARWGGDEFLVVLPMTPLEGAVSLGERVRAAVGDRPFTVGPNQTCRITVSSGCACGSGVDPDDLIERADGALYKAKTAGRDCVAVAD